MTEALQEPAREPGHGEERLQAAAALTSPPAEIPPAERYVFCVLLSDREDADGLAQLLEEVRIVDGPSAGFVAPPVLGTEFFSSLTAGTLSEWWTANIGQAAVVYLLQHDDGVPSVIAAHQGLFYVGLPTADLQPLYPLPTHSFVSGSPLDFATVIMRDFSGGLPGVAPLFDEGDALRMAALSADFSIDIDTPTGGENEAQAHFWDGRGHFEAKEYEAALREFDASLEAGDAPPGLVHLWRAASYSWLDKSDEQNHAYMQAIQSCTDVIDAGGQDVAQAYSWRAEALDSIGEPAAAVADIAKAVELGADSPELLYSQGCLLSDVGRYGEALIAFDSALDHDPGHVSALQAKGVILAYQEKYEPAIQALQAVLALDKSRPAVHRTLGAVFHLQGKFPEALNAYDRAAALGYKDPIAELSRGVTLDAMERYEPAITCFERALQGWSGAQSREAEEGLARAYSGMAHARMAIREYGAAESACREARACGDTSAQTLTLHGLALCRLNRMEDAEASIQRALQQRSASDALEEWRIYAALASVHLGAADLYQDDDYLELATDAIGDALRRLPNKLRSGYHEDVARLYLHRGFALARLGRYGDASRDLRRCSDGPATSSVRLVAKRYLRRLQAPKGLEVPPWLSPVIAVVAALLIAGAAALLVIGRLDSPSFVALVLGLVALPVVTYALPTLSKFKLGPAELERDLGGIGHLRLSPLQVEPPRFALVLWLRPPKRRK